MLHNLRFFFSSKCRLFHNATFFGSCIIHILNTGVLKCKRKFRRQSVKMDPQKLECEGMDCIDLAPDRDRWRALVKAVMNIQLHNK